jgi:hypothetical protein
MITIRQKVHFTRGKAGRRRITTEQPAAEAVQPGRVPRISRLMALAIRFDRLIREGKVTDQSELARLAHVTQPRMTQIMNLNHLAPDIQEELLFLPGVTTGRDPIHEKMLRGISAEIGWQEQRRLWAALRPSIVFGAGVMAKCLGQGAAKVVGLSL